MKFLPMRVHLDYETRDEHKLELVGAIEYAKTADIFCLAYKINHSKVKLWIPELARMPEDLWMAFQHGVLVAHNASFERAITKWCLPRYERLGTITRAQAEFLEAIPASRWRCTAAKAAASSLPRNLEMACAVMRTKTQKDMAGNKLIKKYSKPRKPTKKNPSRWWDDPADLKRIYAYCKTDVQAEYELDQELPDLSEYEQKVWELDQKINDRGILIDVPLVRHILTMIDEEMKNINGHIQKLSDGTIETAGQTAKILKWVNKHGAELPNLQAQTVRDALNEDLPDNVRSMLRYRQAGSKTSTGKYIAMLHAVGRDHRARELLLYHGTVPTARWSGKRVQPHNFPRPTIKDFNMDEAIKYIKKGHHAVAMKYGRHNVMEVLVCAVRGMLIASPGHELYCADYAAIEARLAFWVSGHEEGLEGFRLKRKLYEEMAAETFDLELEWLLTEEGKASLERFIGKESVLGCQYGMGWAKFKSQCHKKGQKSVTDEIAKKAVYTYRRVHYPVVECWGNLERAAIEAIMEPGTRVTTNRVTFYVKGKWLNIKLPSGRRLRYYKPTVGQKEVGRGSGKRMVPEIRYWGFYTVNSRQVWGRISIWGGVFMNHICQGIARDMMVAGIFNIDEAGYKFLLSVHDECLAERKRGKGSVAEYVKLMTTLPAWADGAPITAEGWCGQRYRK